MSVFSVPAKRFHIIVPLVKVFASAFAFLGLYHYPRTCEKASDLALWADWTLLVF